MKPKCIYRFKPDLYSPCGHLLLLKLFISLFRRPNFWFISNNILSSSCRKHYLSPMHELFLTLQCNVTIGFQKVEWATQILVKVSRLTVNSSAPKPHFPLHRFSESGVRGLVQGGGGGEREEAASNATVAFPFKDVETPPENRWPSSDTWRMLRSRKLCSKWHAGGP